MTTTLLKTPLHDWHVARGARMVDFGGWSMPVQYTSIVQEHNACRNAVALFDVSHMGRLVFPGIQSAAFLDSICTRRVSDLPEGRIRYSLLCNDAGGVLDDVLVYHWPDTESTEMHFFEMVVNAGNREKVVSWIEKVIPDEVSLLDCTETEAMFAVQGPSAMSTMQSMADITLSDIPYYHVRRCSIAGHGALVSRTGYTGEDGVEIIVRAELAAEVWETVHKAGNSNGIQPAGLGARDTLRLEAAMPLYGHELSEAIGPIQAGLDFAVNLKDREFIGKQAIEKQKQDATLPRRVGLEMSGRRVPREHYGVFHGDEKVGEVSSGTFSPTLERPIAMAYVHPHIASEGTTLSIDIRGRREPARVVPLPFYKRT